MSDTIIRSDAKCNKRKKNQQKNKKKLTASELEQDLKLEDSNLVQNISKNANQNELAAISEKKRAKGKNYKLNEQLGEENLYTEFKNFTCPEIIEQQYKILTKLICGFLNAEGGKILIGVDNAACIKGN